MAGSKERILGFDIARVVAMFYVIGILHLSGYTDLSIIKNWSCRCLTWSTLGVFTFLSAFLLGSRYSFSNNEEIKNFFKKRILRFYPLFFISSIMLYWIHLNTWSKTWKGLIGLSPFWLPQQNTLWYIATLMILYCITPLLCYKRINLFSRLLISVSIILFAVIIQILFHSVDPRFFYYYTVYALGLFCAMYGSSLVKKILESKYSLLVMIIWLPLLLLLSRYRNWILMEGVGYLGILVILNISVLIGLVIRSNQNALRTINYLSFGSMCAYLFHREIFWLLLKIYQPTYEGGGVNDWGTIVYLFFIGLPLVFVSSYYIQKLYDSYIRKI